MKRNMTLCKTRAESSNAPPPGLRTAFNRQPARVLLLDLHPPTDPQTIEQICLAMEQVFAVVCSLTGPNRIPFFGLITIGSYPEVLFPLQHVRGNYARLQASLTEIRSMIRSLDHQVTAGRVPIGSRYADGIREAAAVFKRQAQGLLQTTGYSAQLEVTLMTGQEVTRVSKEMDKVAKELDIDGLKKVQVVSVTNPDRLYIPEEASIQLGSQVSDSSDVTSTSGDSGGLVEFTTIENHVLFIENFLKAWLHDCSTDKEHLHVVLPGPDGSNKVLKCDLQDRILNPDHLPFPFCFNLALDSQEHKSTSTTGRTSKYAVPVHKLIARKRINVDTVCESVLYGMPQVVRSTTCWKIDWDELETNQQNFTSLCHLLFERNEVLLVTLDTDRSSTTASFRYNPQPPKPTGHFLLLPSHKNTMLLKPIASKELMLPLDISGVDQPTDDSMRGMSECLERIDGLDGYNPVLTSASLHSSLVYHLTKNFTSSTGGTAGKRKPVHTTTGSEIAHHAHTPATKPSSTFTPAKWTVQSQKRARPMSSGKDFYTFSDDSFPSEL